MSTKRPEQDKPNSRRQDESDSDADSSESDENEIRRRQGLILTSPAWHPEYDDHCLIASDQDGTTLPCEHAGCHWPCDHHTHDGHLNVDFKAGYDEIKRSATSGCVYCAVIYQIADGTCGCKLVPPGIPQRRHSCTHLYYTGNRRCLILQWACGLRYVDMRAKQGAFPDPSIRDTQDAFTLSLPANETIRTAIARYPLQRELRFKAFRDRLCDSAIELYSSWLAECETIHQDCSVKDSAFCPTRLLDLAGDNLTSSVRLVVPGDDVKRYAALSYCWGGRDPSLTTHGNIKQRLDHIPFEGLRKCYQDAVCLLRRLKIRYLWIDSYCIIQDDKVDYDQEASQMGKVYRNARLVVIAAMAASVDCGFLRRTMRRWQALPIRASSDPTAGVQVSARRHVMSSGTRPSASMPVGYRGWCYQEHAIARRCLIFRDDEVVWECAEGFNCECKRETFKDMFRPSVMKSEVPKDRDDLWLEMVEEFSWTKFTFMRDRLPALAALASHLKTATDASYLAGLWSSDLLPQLLWKRSTDHSIARPETFVAPSWSWASFPSGISVWLVHEWRDESQHPKKRVIQREALVAGAWCSPSGIDPFGAVNGGAIQLDAYHCLATVSIDDHGYFATLKTGCEFDLSQSSFDWLLTSVPLMTDPGRRRHTLQAQLETDVHPPPTTLSGDVRILQVFNGYFLLLAYSQREEGAFERLGLVTHMSCPSLTPEKREQIQAASTRSVVKII